MDYLLWPVALPLVVGMRVLRPWCLIRLNPLMSDRLGHFAANTELYLCERDAKINVPAGRVVDICYFAGGSVANQQLATMWRRRLRVWPAPLMRAVRAVNRRMGGGGIHEVGTNTQWDRDLHDLLPRTSPHLRFRAAEEQRGQAGLRDMGLPDGAEFICLISRDETYLQTAAPLGSYDYHAYRNVDIQDFAPAAEALGDLGYYVIRMGSVVKAPFRSSHPKVIDYATSGMRSDFMDVYLGAHCFFCLSVSTGFDAVPTIFRRPIAYANMAPIGYVSTFQDRALFICKGYRSVDGRRRLTLRETFDGGVGFLLKSSEYAARGVDVVANTPAEITALAMEMAQRMNGAWQPNHEDDELQRRFWDLFPVDARDRAGTPLHGRIRARHGAQFLRDHREWLA